MNWADYGLKGLAILGAITLAYWVGKKGIVPVWNWFKNAGALAKSDWASLETRLATLEASVFPKVVSPVVIPVPAPAAGTAPLATVVAPVVIPVPAQAAGTAPLAKAVS